MPTEKCESSFGWLRSRGGIALLVFLAIAAFLIITEHTAHLLGALPFVFLLLCPIMHLFMHHGSDQHTGHAAPDAKLGLPPSESGGRR